MKRAQLTVFVPLAHLNDFMEACELLLVEHTSIELEPAGERKQSQGRRKFTKGPPVDEAIFRKIKVGQDLGYSRSLLSKVRSCETYGDFRLERQKHAESRTMDRQQ